MNADLAKVAEDRGTELARLQERMALLQRHNDVCFDALLHVLLVACLTGFFFFQNLEERDHILEGEISLLQDEYRELFSRTNAGQEHVATSDGTNARLSSKAADSSASQSTHVVEGPSLSMPASAFGTGESKTLPGQQGMQQDRKAIQDHQKQQSAVLSSNIDAKTKEARAILDELVVAQGQSEDDVCISSHSFTVMFHGILLIACFRLES